MTRENASPGSEINSVNSVNIDTQNHKVTDYRHSPNKAAFRNNYSGDKDHFQKPSYERNVPKESRHKNANDYEIAYRLKKESISSKMSKESIRSERETGPTFRDPEIAKSAIPLSH